MNTSLFRSGRLPALLLIVVLLLCSAFAEENDWYVDTAKALTEKLGAIATVFHESGDEIITVTACPLFGPENKPFSDVAQSLTTVLPMAQITQLF